MKSAKNKTIDISVEQGKKYLNRCIDLKEKTTINKIINKTIIGDSINIMQKLPPAFVDLLIVDPPYNLSKNFHGNKFTKTSAKEYQKYTKQWVSKVIPLLKPNASIYVCCDWMSSMIIGPILEQNFNILNRITWQREKGRGSSKNWKNGMEDIWFATNGKAYTFNLDSVKLRRKVLAPYKHNGQPKDWEETSDGRFRDTCPSNFWDDISIPYWSMPENTAHPTQKPEKLIAKLILASSRPNDVVFDPFLGSGTTSVTAKKLGRKYVGIEQNPTYCIWAEKRLELADKNPQIQGYSDGIFWERNTILRRKKL